MKYFIMSDIHGSATACEKALAQFEKLNCDQIILLGDVLYYGPRNPLPEGHDPKAVATMLNSLAGKITACRGNCDSEVDQMLLDFPVLADYALLADDGVKIFASHGHIYSPPSEKDATQPVVVNSKLPPPSGIDIALFGHVHIQHLYCATSGVIVCNPGSISLPKADSPAGFAVYEKNGISLYDLDGVELNSLAVTQ